MELKVALQKIYLKNQKLDDSVGLGLLLDYCSDKSINRDYAKLFWKINKEVNIYDIFLSLGIKDGYKKLEDKLKSFEFNINKNDYLYILDSVAYLFDERSNDVKKSIVTTKNVRNIISKKKESQQSIQSQKVDVIDIKLTTNNLRLVDNNNIPLYPSFIGVNLINGILLGDPTDDVELNLTKEDLKEGYIVSNSGDIIIDYIKIKNLDISVEAGDVFIGPDAIIDDLKVSSIIGDITITNANINKIDVCSVIGDISINNKYVNTIIANSEMGDISINANTKNIRCKTQGSKHIRNFKKMLTKQKI